jgi:hypothetical protein
MMRKKLGDDLHAGPVRQRDIGHDDIGLENRRTLQCLACGGRFPDYFKL